MKRQGSIESCPAAFWSAAAALRLVAARAAVLGLVAAAGLGLSAPAFAQPVKGVAEASKPGAFARVLLKLATDVEAEVRMAGTILIVQFKRPIEVDVDRLAEGAPDYIGSSRLDPDGGAIRVALTRKVKPNVMAAGERLFIDLLPETWAGAPPPLPPEVVKELAERAREAEKALKRQERATAAQKKPPIRVRASLMPTFTRYSFDLPEGGNVSSVLNKDRLVLVFDDPGISFDLADAKVADPANVASVNQIADKNGVMVEFGLLGDVDVRSFQQDRAYIVDIGAGSAARAAKPGIETIPALPIPVAPAAAAPKASGAAPAETEGSKAASKDAHEEKSAAAAPDAEASQRQVVVAAAGGPDSFAPSVITGGPETATATRSGNTLKLTFPFQQPTAAAAFLRADTLWMVFDSAQPFDVSQLAGDSGPMLRDVQRMPLPSGQAIRVRLNKTQLATLTSEGSLWVVHIGEPPAAAEAPLAAARNIADPAMASVNIQFIGARKSHLLMDPETGLKVIAVTGPQPVRGFIKKQNFVEFSLLESMHGVIVEPKADDLKVDLAPDNVAIGRPGGLTLSGAAVAATRGPEPPRPLFDPAIWEHDAKADFIARRDALWARVIGSEAADHDDARLDLARFYLAHGFYPEAQATLAALRMDDSNPQPLAARMLIVRGVATILAGHPDRGLTDLADPAIGAGYDLRLWKGIGLARKQKWAEARELFKGADFSISTLPIALQRIVILEALRAALEMRDFSGVSSRLNELQIVGIPAGREGYVALLKGRAAEALGREKDALADYRMAAAGHDKIAAAEAKLLAVTLARKLGEMTEAQAQAELETLAMTWRGDMIEIRALQQLAAAYETDKRYREALMAARTATLLAPDSPISRQMQDRASALFGQLFNGAKADAMPPIEALALFYEFRDLTPIGRRGDEMIRHLADRLAAVDLLEQATELLQYQVESRLEGSARAQVAARLAMLYLLNRKPDRALAALRATRLADLNGELRQQRLLLEARGQSDIGRRDLALDIIANLTGREATRLRSDIHWAARRWREASEQIELLHGERWKEPQPLDGPEKADILRAAIGYSLADDQIGLTRLKERYAGKMTEEADRDAFAHATKLAAANSAEFAQIAKMAAAVDTLDGFLRDMKKRFQDRGPQVNAGKGDTGKSDTGKSDAGEGDAGESDITATGALPKIQGQRRADAKP